MATVKTASYGVERMVDNTPEPLLEPPVKAAEEDGEEGTPNQTGIETNKSWQEEQKETDWVEDEKKADDIGESKQDHVSEESMELNDAFLALEEMRKYNLDHEFGGKAIPNAHLLHNYCTTCLYENKEKEEEKMKRLMKDPNYTSNPNKEKRRTWCKQAMTRVRSKRSFPPCLICSSPVCSKHCCKEFKDEKINVCSKCSALFTMDFVVATMKNNNSTEERQQAIEHMIDSYDRALLILRYSAQYIEEIAQALENRSRTTDHIGLGSSSVGLMSGLTGVAAVTAQFVAAAAILSPAGPPLVVASILFGASAAAASGGTEAVNYYSTPNQLACKIIALHDLLRSLVGVSAVLKGAMAQGYVDSKHFTEMTPNKKKSAYWKSRAPVVETVVEKADEEDEIEEVTETSVSLEEDDVTTAPVETPKQESAANDDKSPPDTVIEAEDEAVENPAEPANNDKPKRAEEAKSETASTYYKMSEIDDDDDEEPEECDEKQDTETLVTESSSFGSEEDAQDKVMAEDSPTVTERTAVMVAPSTSSETKATPSVEKAPAGLAKPTSTEITGPNNKRATFSRALTNSMKVAAFASIACVMLSAATIIMETKNLQDTLANIRRGSPCEKAAALRKIKKDIEDLPDTSVLAKEWKAFLSMQREGKEAAKSD